MPFVVVGAVTIPIQAPGGARHDVEEFGERQRAFDGTMLTAVRARKDRWGPLTSVLLARAATDTAIAALNATPPVSCSGDFLNATVNCHPQYHGLAPEPVANGITMYRISFTLHAQ